MEKTLIPFLGLCLVFISSSAPAQEPNAVRTCEALFQGNDESAVEAANAWIDQDGGVLAWYYLGRIHMRHGRYTRARLAFKAGLKALSEESTRTQRVLRSRLRRLDRLTVIMESREQKSRALLATLHDAAELAGQKLLKKGWKKAGIHHLALARCVDCSSTEARRLCTKLGVEDAVHLKTLRMSPGWKTLLPSQLERWRWLDTRIMEEKTTSLASPDGLLVLKSGEEGAFLHDMNVSGKNMLWTEFMVSPRDGLSHWQAGILFQYRNPRDFHVLMVGPNTVEVKRFVVEKTGVRGGWNMVETRKHNLATAPNTWHCLVVSMSTASNVMTVYLDETRVASFSVGNALFGKRAGLFGENATVTFRKVKVGKS